MTPVETTPGYTRRASCWPPGRSATWPSPALVFHDDRDAEEFFSGGQSPGGQVGGGPGLVAAVDGNGPRRIILGRGRAGRIRVTSEARDARKKSREKERACIFILTSPQIVWNLSFFPPCLLLYRSSTFQSSPAPLHSSFFRLRHDGLPLLADHGEKRGEQKEGPPRSGSRRRWAGFMKIPKPPLRGLGTASGHFPAGGQNIGQDQRGRFVLEFAHKVARHSKEEHEGTSVVLLLITYRPDRQMKRIRGKQDGIRGPGGLDPKPDQGKVEKEEHGVSMYMLAMTPQKSMRMLLHQHGPWVMLWIIRAPSENGHDHVGRMPRVKRG